MQSRLKVSFIVDDPVYNGLLHLAIFESHDMQLSSSGTSIAQGLALLTGEAADVLLIDIGLPDSNSLEVIQQARLSWPACQVMVISVFPDRKKILAAIVAGANGHILKDVTPQQLSEEIRTLVAEGSAISPSIARVLLDHVRQVDESTVSVGSVDPSLLLTRREHEVLTLANKGLTYGEIASNLSLSVHTVKTYVKRAYQKLQVTSKTEALYELQRARQVFDQPFI